jgi:hypothetical protein
MTADNPAACKIVGGHRPPVQVLNAVLSTLGAKGHDQMGFHITSSSSFCVWRRSKSDRG